MVGMMLKAVCPACGKKFYTNFGVTQYVRVNGSRKSYASCQCTACEKPLWIADSGGPLADVLEKKDDDEIESAGVICW